VLFGDMRHIDLPELADILVTELLGSFGDNELSPECLDGAMRLLKRKHLASVDQAKIVIFIFILANGLSIPLSYTAHLAPLSSAKLYQEARIKNDSACMETPYVVMFEAVNMLSGDGGGPDGWCGPQVQPCWTFVHPRKDPEMDLRGMHQLALVSILI
jgi:protein arginine N-methyltransferase 5